MMKKNTNRIHLLNVPIDALSKKDVFKVLDDKRLIVTPNPEILLLAKKNKAYRKALKSADLFLADGHGLQFTSTMLRFPKPLRYILYFPALVLFLFYKKPFQEIIPEVIHGSDFMNELVKHSVEKQYSVFLLGAKDGVADLCAKVFLKKYPKLNIVGTSSSGPSELTMKEVAKTNPDVLFVAYGAPKQEFWMIKFGVKIKSLKHIVGVGGSFDFWSGEIKRAPLPMRKLGLEWLWRLILQPRVRAKRIFNALVAYPLISFSCEKKSS